MTMKIKIIRYNLTKHKGKYNSIVLKVFILNKNKKKTETDKKRQDIDITHIISGSSDIITNANNNHY